MLSTAVHCPLQGQIWEKQLGPANGAGRVLQGRGPGWGICWAALRRGNGSAVDVVGAQHAPPGGKVDGDRERRKRLKEKELVNKRLVFTFPPPMYNGR